MNIQTHVLLKPVEFAGQQKHPGETVELNAAQAQWCIDQGIIAAPAPEAPEPEPRIAGAKVAALRRGSAS